MNEQLNLAQSVIRSTLKRIAQFLFCFVGFKLNAICKSDCRVSNSCFFFIFIFILFYFIYLFWSVFRGILCDNLRSNTEASTQLKIQSIQNILSITKS